MERYKERGIWCQCKKCVNYKEDYDNSDAGYCGGTQVVISNDGKCANMMDKDKDDLSDADWPRA